MDASEASGKLVFEADDVSKALGGAPVIRDYSQRILRGDRVGLIGPNGSGKTTLLRMLVGEMEPDSGEVRHGARLQVAYYDQQREQLDPERTVADTVNDGNDTVTVNGEARHVIGYLADFLFPRERAQSPVKLLSGGERNRLLLARLFAQSRQRARARRADQRSRHRNAGTARGAGRRIRGDGPPGQPRPDLPRQCRDQHAGVRRPGRRDGVRRRLRGLPPPVGVGSSGAGGRSVTAGGRRGGSAAHRYASRRRPGAVAASKAVASQVASKSLATSKKKLSFQEKRELEALPARIAALEAEQASLQAEAAGPSFYRRPPDAIREVLARIEALPAEIEAALARWVALDERA